MSGRRQFGAIRRLASGRWQARFRHPETNALVPAPRTFPTKGDAARWLSTVEADLARGRFFDPLGGQVPLREYAERWLEQRPLRPRTEELYQGLLDHHILPVLGEVSLCRLAPGAVREWHAELLALGRPGSVTVAKCYRLLHAICETAVSDELISRNPCNVKGAAVERSPERPMVSVTEVAQLADAIEPRYRVMVLLAAWCGLRLGEVLALTVGDVDLASGRVVVDKTISELRSGEWHSGPPKSVAGKRVVAIPPHVLGDITRHVSTYCESNPASLLVTGCKGGAVRRLVFHAAWRRAAVKVGVPALHYHDLRHAGATFAATTGATTRELMLRLGHASPAAALRYQHATQDRDDAIATALSRLAQGAARAGTPCLPSPKWHVRGTTGGATASVADFRAPE